MDDTIADCAPYGEASIFLNHFGDLPDPRQQGKVTDPLDEVLLLCLLGVLAGAECFTEIALFGVKKLSFLRRFRPFKGECPDIGGIMPLSQRPDLQWHAGQIDARTRSRACRCRPHSEAGAGDRRHGVTIASAEIC